MDSKFTELINRVCAGSEDAANELVNSYGDHIQRMVRRKLGMPMRCHLDSTDIVQLVWIRVWENPSVLTEFHNPDQLIRYLTGITHRTLLLELRKATTEKRGVHQPKRPLNEILGTCDEPATNDPNPEECAVLRDSFTMLVGMLGSTDSQILELMLSGKSTREIADQCGLNVRSVQRLSRWVKNELRSA